MNQCLICKALRELAEEIPYPFLDIQPETRCDDCREEEYEKMADLMSLI